ncbi:MAG: hypothetical protein KDD10_03720 [Phaeodactylibacter sp.]|nr:hypothetical protein [Phaeodactylibacter sp.]MCB9298692.1 hypothetical protein [Lewinellaceae bacterium]
MDNKTARQVALQFKIAQNCRANRGAKNLADWQLAEKKAPFVYPPGMMAEYLANTVFLAIFLFFKT